MARLGVHFHGSMGEWKELKENVLTIAGLSRLAFTVRHSCEEVITVKVSCNVRYTFLFDSKRRESLLLVCPEINVYN